MLGPRRRYYVRIALIALAFAIAGGAVYGVMVGGGRGCPARSRGC